jgi:hypothetical protein
MLLGYGNRQDRAMFEGVPFDKLTAPVLVGIAVLMVLLGLLVPRYVYRAKAREAEYWRLAYEAERESRETLQGQNAELLELARTTNKVLVAMFGVSEHVKETGGVKWASSGGVIRKRPRKQSRLSKLLSGIW